LAVLAILFFGAFAFGLQLTFSVGCTVEPVVVLGVLVEVLRSYPIAARGRITSEGEVLFEDLCRCPAQFNARTIALEAPVGPLAE
jgi:hypothetical protein